MSYRKNYENQIIIRRSYGCMKVMGLLVVDHPISLALLRCTLCVIVNCYYWCTCL